jgi:hypothetical protein
VVAALRSGAWRETEAFQKTSGGSVIDSLSYFVVHLTPTLLVLCLAWAVVRAIGVSVVWKRDE